MRKIINIQTDNDILVIDNKRYVISFEELYEQHGNDEGLYVLEIEDEE